MYWRTNNIIMENDESKNLVLKIVRFIISMT